jgi:hypothetical protein
MNNQADNPNIIPRLTTAVKDESVRHLIGMSLIPTNMAGSSNIQAKEVGGL